MKRGSGRSPKLAASRFSPHRFDDLFRYFGPISVRRMFGGEGIYAGDRMIGLVADDQLYLKADDSNRGDFLAEGCGPFTFPRGEKTMTLPYHAVPERLLDDPQEFSGWARKAHEAALAAKPPRKKLR